MFAFFLASFIGWFVLQAKKRRRKSERKTQKPLYSLGEIPSSDSEYFLLEAENYFRNWCGTVLQNDKDVFSLTLDECVSSLPERLKTDTLLELKDAFILARYAQKEINKDRVKELLEKLPTT